MSAYSHLLGWKCSSVTPCRENFTVHPVLEDLGIVYLFSVMDKIYINTTGQTLRSQDGRKTFSAEIKSPSSECWKKRYYILFQLLVRRTIGLLKGNQVMAFEVSRILCTLLYTNSENQKTKLSLCLSFHR